MRSNIIQMIENMGKNPRIDIAQVDTFVDECVAFLKNELASDPSIPLMSDIFELESARVVAHKNCHKR